MSPTTAAEGAFNTQRQHGDGYSPVVGVIVALFPACILGFVLFRRHQGAAAILLQEIEMMVKVKVLLESALREAQTREQQAAVAVNISPERVGMLSF
jgi:ABC-type branched-subunit amino acid transport system permease subunit